MMKRNETPARRRALAAIAALAAGLAISNSALAQDEDIGKSIYMNACAVCHGVDGKGDGEFAQHLNVKPTDLTQLAKNASDGKFPYLDVLMAIDGRTGVRGHGMANMPIWGDVFAADAGEMGGPYGAELIVRARLVAVVDYVNSLQAK